MLSPQLPVENELLGLQGILSGSKALNKPGLLPRFYFSETPCFGFLCVSEQGLKATDLDDILWGKSHSF